MSPDLHTAARAKARRRKILSRIGLYAILIVVAIPFVLPGLWMVVASLKTADQIFAYPPDFFPRQWEWGNYAEVFRAQPFARQYFNSFYIAALVTLFTVAFSSIAGYAFARMRFPWKNVLFLLIMSGFFIPEEVTVIPLYRLASDLGMVNTHWPLIIVPVFAGTGIIGTFVMRQAFLSMPSELEDAARVDGLGWFGLFWRVAMPVVRPTIAVVVILAALGSWNAFLEPLIFLRDPELYTLPLALTQFQNVGGEPTYNVQMAATTLSVLTILAVFVVAQRQIIAGLTSGSVKG